jgi:segregation and condensation protein B
MTDIDPGDGELAPVGDGPDAVRAALAPGAEPATLNALSLPVPPVKQVVEGALMAAGGPLTIDRILGLFPDHQRPPADEVRSAVAALSAEYQNRGIELAEVAGGWRIQVRRDVAPWVGRLWEEKPPRYSRALLETLALIAYRQPITRGEIEEIRGVSVSTQIVKTLTERDWIRVVGHRDVPGRPALYATTRRFLDYFGLRSLNDLPPLAEIRDPAFFADALGLVDGESGGAGDTPAATPDQEPAGHEAGADDDGRPA